MRGGKLGSVPSGPWYESIARGGGGRVVQGRQEEGLCLGLERGQVRRVRTVPGGRETKEGEAKGCLFSQERVRHRTFQVLCKLLCLWILIYVQAPVNSASRSHCSAWSMLTYTGRSYSPAPFSSRNRSAISAMVPISFLSPLTPPSPKGIRTQVVLRDLPRLAISRP